MILDAIVGLFVALVSSLVEVAVLAFVPLANLAAAGIELIVGLFVAGFSLGRIERKKRQPRPSVSATGIFVTLLVVIGLAVSLAVAPKILYRTVTLVAADGHSLPFAALIIHTGRGDQHKRTDDAGNIEISRFTTSAITVKDPRYVEQTWKKSEMTSALVVRRTLLGSGLDSIADLLKPATK